MKTKFKSQLFVTLAAVTLFATGAAHAIPPHEPNLVKDGNRWLITFYNDNSLGHTQWATQGLCFYQIANVGTHTRYVWYSYTFPDWNGWATQEGDQIFMHGDYGRNVGHDGMEWEIVTSSPKSLGTGHWKEWREDRGFGRTIGFGNAKFQRVGKCRYVFSTPVQGNLRTEAELVEEAGKFSAQYESIPLPKSKDGQDIMTPSGDKLSNSIQQVIDAR